MFYNISWHIDCIMQCSSQIGQKRRNNADPAQRNCQQVKKTWQSPIDHGELTISMSFDPYTVSAGTKVSLDGMSREQINDVKTNLAERGLFLWYDEVRDEALHRRAQRDGAERHFGIDSRAINITPVAEGLGAVHHRVLPPIFLHGLNLAGILQTAISEPQGAADKRGEGEVPSIMLTVIQYEFHRPRRRRLHHLHHARSPRHRPGGG